MTIVQWTSLSVHVGWCRTDSWQPEIEFYIFLSFLWCKNKWMSYVLNFNRTTPVQPSSVQNHLLNIIIYHSFQNQQKLYAHYIMHLEEQWWVYSIPIYHPVPLYVCIYFIIIHLLFWFPRLSKVDDFLPHCSIYKTN